MTRWVRRFRGRVARILHRNPPLSFTFEVARLSAKNIRSGKPDLFIVGTMTLAEDLAGILTRVVNEKVPAQIYPGDCREAMRGEFVSEPIAYLIPADQFDAFRAFLVARDSFLNLKI